MGILQRYKMWRLKKTVEVFEKALSKIEAKQKPISETKSLLENPLNLYSDYYEDVESNTNNYFLSDSIRKEAARRGTLSRVIGIRITQLSEFTRPYQQKGSFGFEIVKTDGSKIKGRDKKEIEELTQFIVNLGVIKRKPYEDTFDAFVRKVMWDSLVYDKLCFEIVRDRTGKPAKLQSVDASTIKRVNRKKADETGVHFVQVINGTIVNEYTSQEMVMGARRLRTDISLNGYGMPEIDEIMRELTAEMFGFTYNMQFFRQGAAVRGVLALLGDIPKNQFHDFVRKFRAYVRGLNNAHTMPVVNIPVDSDKGKGDMKFLNLSLPNKDMEYGQWMDFQIKCIAAAYQMDPAEIGHFYGEQGSRMFSQDPLKKINASKDRGFKPLLRFLENIINNYIIWERNPDFMFKFSGYDDITDEERYKLYKERVSTTSTINELRAEDGLSPDPYGDIIANPQYIQYRLQKEQMEQMQQRKEESSENEEENEYSWESENEDEEEETEGEGFESEKTEQEEEQQKSIKRNHELKKARIKVYEVEL